jgi:cbb3-type cytochrome oxidase subunit 3
MPFDAMVTSAVVLVIFIVFAGVIAWADHQTRPERLKKR